MIGAAYNKPNFVPTRQNRFSERRKTGWVFPDPRNATYFTVPPGARRLQGLPGLNINSCAQQLRLEIPSEVPLCDVPAA
jgi:hypothetical protein